MNLVKTVYIIQSGFTTSSKLVISLCPLHRLTWHMADKVGYPTRLLKLCLSYVPPKSSSLFGKNCDNCFKYDFPIHKKTAFTDILYIHLDPFIKRNVISVWLNLPVTRKTRCNKQSLGLISRILLNLSGQSWTRPHNAHISF